MGSIASTGEFRSPSYSISKAALNMATVQSAHALLGQRTNVLALHPGWVRTDMGGAQAAIEPADAVRGMLKVIDAMTLANTGRFLDWQGKTLPW
jgi:NAD(P)-dependent dehydrogenase (short-subunit alcohol dehydrogenase family)